MASDSAVRKAIGGTLIGLGAITAGVGIASPYLWPQSDTIVAATTTNSHSPFIVSSPGVIELAADRVQISAVSPDGNPVSLIVGRQIDVLGWLGDFPYTEITGLQTWETLSTNEIAGSQSNELATITPIGNDMWIFEASGQSTATIDITGDASQAYQMPIDSRGLVFLAATQGSELAPQVTLTWPREVTEPYLWPLVATGIGTMLLGAAIALSRSRRTAAVPQFPAPLTPNWEPLPPPAPPIETSLTGTEAAEVSEQPFVSDHEINVDDFKSTLPPVEVRVVKIGGKPVAPIGEPPASASRVVPEPVVIATIFDDEAEPAKAETKGSRWAKFTRAKRRERPAAVVPVTPAQVVPEAPVEVSSTASTEVVTATHHAPPVSRSELRKARAIAAETGDTELLDALTGAIRAVASPEDATSQIPVQTANWRAMWGLETLEGNGTKQVGE